MPRGADLRCAALRCRATECCLRDGAGWEGLMVASPRLAEILREHQVQPAISPLTESCSNICVCSEGSSAAMAHGTAAAEFWRGWSVLNEKNLLIQH